MKRKVFLLLLATLLFLSGCGSSQRVEEATSITEGTTQPAVPAAEAITDQLPDRVLYYIDKFDSGDPWISLSEKDGELHAEIVVKQENAIPLVADNVMIALQEYAKELNLTYSLRVGYTSTKKDVVTWSLKEMDKKGTYYKDGGFENLTLGELFERYSNFGKED